ncbi:putative protein puf6 [Phaeomoniella chlamydospora]|uniref:PUM-HD domain-containing protein n=1 Tax=Phaeomoniella chlamydospora TaxID=158046 RepID=A0A0G2EZW6_PHACM|nr:putative protein puf6 [Phaeomoniella chlamydospora]
MAGMKRPYATAVSNGNKRAKTKSSASTAKSDAKAKSQPLARARSDSSDVSDSDLDENETSSFDVSGEAESLPNTKTKTDANSSKGNNNVHSERDGFLKASGTTSSREAHAKQKALAQERKASKPNADTIAQSKKLWEKLRRKSHVPLEERKQLIAELFGIITGRVHDFVFKHDSVRVIQTALKYANLEQRKTIATELKGKYKDLAESRYAKFLIAKLMVHGDEEIRDMIVPEFYGNVKRLIRHPEASWILDDIYRTVTTKEQKAVLLREWYGPEFVVFQDSKDAKGTAELSDILKKHPEKRMTILQHLHELTNQLVQKKTTGFTMLHDAMLQYFLNLKPGSTEFNENIQMLLDDEEGDCLKNLAFTKSGARLTCLTLAHASAKDRKLILRHYKSTIKMLASDQYAHMVLLTAFDVIDDTVMTGKAIFPELLSKDLEATARDQELLAQSMDLTGRIPLLYLFNSLASQPKWLLTPHPSDSVILSEIHTIRQTTSKKDPEIRRLELVKSLYQPLLDLISANTEPLFSQTSGTQFICEVLLNTPATEPARLAAQNSLISFITSASTPASLLSTRPVGRLLKTLVQSGKFDPATKTLVPSTESPLEFANLLFDALTPDTLIDWATGPNSFVIVAMVERGNTLGEDTQKELRKILKGKDAKKKIDRAANGKGGGQDGEDGKANAAGAKILKEVLGL